MMRFMAGWFDRLELRLGYMTAYDSALNSERKTVTVQWGML